MNHKQTDEDIAYEQWERYLKEYREMIEDPTFWKRLYEKLSTPDNKEENQ